MIRRRPPSGKSQTGPRPRLPGAKSVCAAIERAIGTFSVIRRAHCWKETAVKILNGWTIAALVCAGCSTSPSRMSADAKLALYSAHAGAPVDSFRLLGRLTSWEALGSEALVVWTRPNEAWLLEPYGPCDGLDYSSAISLTDHAGRVEAGLDYVLVSNPSPIHLPCKIRGIRPLDLAAIREAEKERRSTTTAATPVSH